MVKKLIVILFTFILSACGGTGSSDSGVPTPSPTPTGCSVAVSTGPFALTWPTLSWEHLSPASQGMCPDGISDAITYAFNSDNDGDTVAVGAYGNDGNGTDSGQVRIFDLNSSAWVQRGIDIDGEAADDLFGYYVSISNDGNTVAIGAWNNDGNGTDSGHVRIFDWK